MAGEKQKATTSPEALTTRRPWAVVGCSRASWKRMQATGETPPPISLPGLDAPRWRVADIVRWLESRKADRRVRKGPGRTGSTEADPTTSSS